MRSVFVLGDSISIHYGPDLARFIAGRYTLSRKGTGLGPEDDAGLEGTNGGTSRQVLRYLRERFPQADLLLLNCGLHDIAHDHSAENPRVSIEEYKENLLAITALLREKRQPALWVSSTPVDDERHRRCNPSITRKNADMTAYNQAAEQIMRQAGIPVADLNAFVCSLSGDLYLDHVHYTSEVRRLQAAFLAGHILAQPGA